MKRYFGIALILGIVAVLGVVTLVNAQGSTPPAPVPGQGGWNGMMGRSGMMGRGMMGGAGGSGVMHEYMQQALADKLGMTVDELNQHYAKGETYWQVAEAKGFTEAQAVQMMTDARNSALDQLVKDGTITQEQADQMRERMGQGGCMGGYNLNAGPSGTSQNALDSAFPRRMMGRW